MKLTLKSKISIWFLVIILISLVLYGTLIFFVYKFNIRGEKFVESLKEHPWIEQSFIDRVKELNRPGLPPPITILSPRLFMRIFFTITGGVLFIIVISTGGGFLVLRKMLSQVDVITRNVREIDEKRLHLRLNLRGKDSISNMAKTFDNMLDKIEDSFKKQKQFVQNASHELNTPLTVIKTKIDVLKQKKTVTKKEYNDTLALIDSEIMRLSKITEELLMLSELEENWKNSEFTVVNIKKVLEKMLSLFENQISSKNLLLRTHYDGEFEILGINTQIEQLIFNMLDNAIKHSVTERELEVSLINDEEGKNLVFILTNVSENIKEGDIPYIFDRFYKASNAVDRKGFGLGLSISKKIIENHNGKIEVEYVSDKKAITFKIFLPLLKKNKESI